MKNFKQKLAEQFKLLDITALKEAKHHYHLYADYVELVCLLTEGYVSPTDIIDRLTDEGVKFSPEEETSDGEIGLRETEMSDAQERWINLIFDHIQEREKSFGFNYPFIVDSTGIKLNDNKKINGQLIYIYLLISSMLKYFNKLQPILTTEFELLSGEVLKEFLPSRAIIVQFGKNTAYKGNARDKIRALAIELNIDMDEYEINQISKLNNQEEGLDLIAWIPFEDNNPNTIIILGQSGCGKDWFGKKFETSRYENFFHFYKQPPIHTLFIPYAISNNEGRFHQSKDIIKPTLIFERKRLLEYSQDQVFFNRFKSKKIVEKCIEYIEDIV